MLKTIAVLLLTLSTLLLVNLGQAADASTNDSNFRAPAVATTALDRTPAFIGTIELI